jgi:hypothetical protein
MAKTNASGSDLTRKILSMKVEKANATQRMNSDSSLSRPKFREMRYRKKSVIQPRRAVWKREMSII